MVKIAMSRPARVVTASRPFDHVYDPIYTASSVVDQQKTLRRSMMSNIVRVPDFNNLFSEIGTFPSFGYRMQARATIPTVNVGDALRTRHDAPVDITGKDRYMFFNRPLVPYMQAVPVEVILSPHQADAGAEAPAPDAAPLKRTVGTQSIYRDESSQTMPYSSDYVIADGNNPPDILLLKEWVPEHPTKISLREIEQIERQQARRAFEDSLPPMTTDEDFQRRTKLLQEREMKECLYRESQIIAVEKLKHAALVQAIQDREAQRDAIARKRLEAIAAKNAAARATVLDKIQKKRYNAMRKINRERVNLPLEMLNKGARDIVNDYSDFGSPVYAPLERNGKIARPNTDAVVRKQVAAMTRTYEAIVALEMAIPPNALNMTVKKPKKIQTELTKTRQGQAIVADIDKIDAILKSAKLGPAPGSTWSAIPTTQLYAKPVGIVRPTTPVDMAKAVGAEQQDRDAAARLVQRVLRGRAVQADMLRGIRDSIDLIRELLEPQSASSTGPSSTLSADECNRFVLDYAIGAILSKACDTLRSDVVTQEQLQKMQALMERAHLTRVRREAAETGHRQKQFAARAKLQSQIAQIDDIVHKSTVLFLDPLVQEAVSEVARDRAKVKRLTSDAVEDQTAAGAMVPDQDVILDCLEHTVLEAVDDKLQNHQGKHWHMPVLISRALTYWLQMTCIRQVCCRQRMISLSAHSGGLLTVHKSGTWTLGNDCARANERYHWTSLSGVIHT
ncbi:Cilia- and flagella-associated protein 91 [Plasmodiophora brassicae]|uniref:Cilia- and flagella-associated protein 91 n=1 Tax=Plasmodiophora brassicae TaxID=37360 RepID=A0A0G4IYJ1_PLABS|nr:hypothetical protein PBRA_001487 [Plasmodiophora brassicae]